MSTLWKSNLETLEKKLGEMGFEENPMKNNTTSYYYLLKKEIQHATPAMAGMQLGSVTTKWGQWALVTLKKEKEQRSQIALKWQAYERI